MRTKLYSVCGLKMFCPPLIILFIRTTQEMNTKLDERPLFDLESTQMMKG